MQKIRVLLVDDHAILREGLQAMLSLCEDIEVIGGAADGSQALEILQRYIVDVIVMDMAMPGMGGLEATRRIVKSYPHLKVLVLSQHDDERYVLSVCQEGASGYVLKRSVGKELISAIRTVYQGGSYLPPAIADKLLRAFRNPNHSQTVEVEGSLTDREREILIHVCEGMTSQEISELLSISKKTVMCHRANIYKKLGTHRRVELIKYAHQAGLIQLI
jgi:DNA-binding NarL/FixJ family response regulator